MARRQGSGPRALGTSEASKPCFINDHEETVYPKMKTHPFSCVLIGLGVLELMIGSGIGNLIWV